MRRENIKNLSLSVVQTAKNFFNDLCKCRKFVAFWALKIHRQDTDLVCNLEWDLQHLPLNLIHATFSLSTSYIKWAITCLTPSTDIIAHCVHKRCLPLIDILVLLFDKMSIQLHLIWLVHSRQWRKTDARAIFFLMTKEKPQKNCLRRAINSHLHSSLG
jgi:hypothetical protein